MVEYLFDVAKRKKVQIVFTTHSEYALSVLPPKAIWACIDGIAYQGKLTIESLRALTGNVTKDAAIFVEDEFAKDLVEEMLRQYDVELLERISVHKAGGYPYVVEVLKHHNDNPANDKPAVAVIDGDNPPLKVPNNKVIELPDGSPEAIVFQHVSDNLEEMAALIQQRCQCPTISQDKVVKSISTAGRDTTDIHLYFAQIGKELGYISEIVIRRGFISIYVENNEVILRPMAEKIREQLGLSTVS
jgi:hypothetical protein